MTFREQIEQNDAAGVAAAIAAGADPNGHDDTLLPWVTFATRAEAYESLRALLENGGRAEGPEGEALSPLFVAIKMGKVTAVEMLIAHGADVNRPLPQGNTALHLATHGALAPALVGRLLAAGAKVDAFDGKGHTPLMKAASEGESAVVAQLLKAGADKEAIDPNTGRIAWDLARDAGFEDVCKLLGRSSAATAPVISAAPVSSVASSEPRPSRAPTVARDGLIKTLDSTKAAQWQIYVAVAIVVIVLYLAHLKLATL